MRKNRSHEFDHLCAKNRGLDNQSLISLFNDSIPYSFNLFSKRNESEIIKAKEIVDHLQNGYPYQAGRLRFDERDEDVYAYLLMMKATTTFEESNGELARKLNYAIERMNFHEGFNNMHPERFEFVLKELADQENEKQILLQQEEEFRQSYSQKLA